MRSPQQHNSGVYQINCETPDCNKPYYGRTMKDLPKRIVDHDENIDKMVDSSALVQHMKANPGHRFDTSSARIIWKTHNKYESQLVEAACIQRFPSCNISRGDIRMTPAIASITTHIAGLNRYVKRHGSSQQLGPTSHLSVPPATPPSSNLQHLAAPQHPATSTPPYSGPTTTPLRAQPSPSPSPPTLITSVSHMVSATQPPSVSIAQPSNVSISASQPCLTHTHLQHVQSSSPRRLKSNPLPKNYRSLK